MAIRLFGSLILSGVMMLEHLGYEVTEAGDGQAALALYREALAQGRGFAAVIMDLTVPGGMGGREAAQELHRLDPGARVVVASGYSNDPVLANYEEYGFCAAVVKPFRLEELAAGVEAALSSAS